LVDTKIKLDQKVIAIVGPNEAGKTTLLRALGYADRGGDMPLSQRSRSAGVPDATPIVSLRYLLSNEDQAAVDDLDLAERPTEVRVSRTAAGGNPEVEILPRPRKSDSDLHALIADLGAGLDETTALTLSPAEGEEEDDRVGDGGASLLDAIGLLQSDLSQFAAIPVDDRVAVGPLRERGDELLRRLSDYEQRDVIEHPLRRLCEWVDRQSPLDAVRDRLWGRTPDVVMFDDDDRSLASAYGLDEALVEKPPAALANLARLAQLDLRELQGAITTGQIARRDTIKNKANANLAAYFAKAWQQSELTVVLNVEDTVLRIGLVEDGIFASVFDERSAGLRMFVALTAFLATRDSVRPKVLLIDEAENHLHIDAQADLVEMFAQQDKADKVIYTTHSPACLPADLGVGIRALVVDGDETSHVENSFWRQDGRAFSSLMFAMGASAAAFTPARCAVIAEGATDMILLPSLVRAAAEIGRLPYQVAPGLSEVPRDLYPDLDFEAAKVAFLVDGDSGGNDLAKILGREVPPDRIIKLAVPGIENVLDPKVYRATFMELLSEVNPGIETQEPPPLPALEANSWAKALEQWARQEGLRVPTKVEVANALIERDDFAPSRKGIKHLKGVHERLCKALGLTN
jgi:ABC-type transport system involved in cytochrome c biogenesis ATPase subunit